MSRLALSLLAGLMLTATAVQAETYRWVDPATGRTMITDTPPPGKVKTVSKSGGGETDDAGLSYATQQAMASFPVTLYTSPDYPAECAGARSLLQKRGIPFTEKALRKPEDIEELKKLAGDAFVPTLKVGKEVIKGFQADSYNNLLDMVGYPKQALPGKPSGEQR